MRKSARSRRPPAVYCAVFLLRVENLRLFDFGKVGKGRTEIEFVSGGEFNAPVVAVAALPSHWKRRHIFSE